MMEPSYQISEEIGIVTFGKIVNRHTTPKIAKKIQALTQENALRGIIFSFTNVKVLDSSGIGWVVLTNKHLTDDGLPLRLCHLNAHLLGLFKMTGVNQALKICLTVEEAMYNIKHNR